MATLFNTKISDTYVGLLKTIDNAVITASLKELTDGSGNQSGLYLNTAGDFKVTSILEWGSLKDTGTGVTITQFVTAANGIQNFNNDTTVPTSAAVKLYVDTKFATTDTLAEVLVFGNTTSGRDIVVSANDDITFTDSSKAKFGASGDLEIYHNGSHSYIADVNTGSLYIQTNGSAIYLQDTDGKAMAQFSKGGGSFLMYNGNLKLGTSNTGATVTGNLTVTGTITGVGGSYLPLAGGTMTGNTIHNDNVKSIYGTGSDLQILHDGSNSYIAETGTGSLFIDSSKTNFQINGSTAMIVNFDSKVGIGTTNPTEKVDVVGTSGNTNIRVYDSSANSEVGIKLQNDVKTWTIQNWGSGGDNLRVLNNAGSTIQLWDDNGDVGIGTDAPQSLLHIASTNPILTIQDTDAATTFNRTEIQNSAGSFLFNTRQSNGTFVSTDYVSSKNAGGAITHQWFILGNEKLRINSTGNVGIGTTSPSEKLEVNGNVKLGDNNKLLLGTSSDLQIYHNGSDSFSENYTGNLTFRQRQDDGKIIFQSDNGSGGITEYLTIDGANEVVSFQKSSKHEDNVKAYFGNASDLQIYHNGSTSYIYQTGVGKLVLNTLNTGINIQAGDGETRFTKWGQNSEVKVDDASQVNKVVLKASGNSYFNGGNVGIGTTSPSEKLEVNGTIKAVHTDSTYAKVKGTGLYFNRSNVYIAPEGDNVSALNVGLNGQRWSQLKLNADTFTISRAAVEFMRVTSSGNVGIGTTSPLGKLQVSEYTVASQGNQGTFGVVSSFANSNTDNIFLGLKNGTYPNRGYAFRTVASGTNSDFTIYEHGQGSGEVFRITSAGNVGIGTTSPTSKLEVNGTATVDGQLNINGDATSSIRIGTGGTNAALIYSLTGDTLSIGANNATNLVCKTNKDVEFRGNLDLTSNGALLLDNTNNNNQMYIRNGGSNAASMQFGSGNPGSNILMQLASDGKLGIGTTSPTEKLSVSGGANVAGKFAVGSTSTHPSLDFYNQGTAYFNGSTTVDDNFFVTNGNVGIGTAAPNASSLLDVSSTTKGVLLPRMTTTQVNAISSPAEGLTVYNTTLNTLCFYNGSNWQKVTSANM